VLSGRL